MPGFGTTRARAAMPRGWPSTWASPCGTIPIDDAVRQHFRDIGHDETRARRHLRERPGARAHADPDGRRQPGRRLRGRHRRPVGAGAGLVHLQRRPHVDVPRQRRGAQDAGALPGRVGGRGRVQRARRPPCCTTSAPRRSRRSCCRWTQDGELEQKTEDTIGPYELHDFFLYQMVRFHFAPPRCSCWRARRSPATTTRRRSCSWLGVFYRRFFSQQFKRSAMPDGPKVGSVALSPRGDWRMPSDASAALWLAEVEAIGRWLAGSGEKGDATAAWREGG